MSRVTSVLLLLLFFAIPANAVRPLGWNPASWSTGNTAIPPCDLVKQSGEDWNTGASGVADLTPTEDSNGWITGFTGTGATNPAGFARAVMLSDLDHTDVFEYCDTDENVIRGASSGTRCPARFPRGEYTMDCSGSTDAKIGIARNADGDPTTTCGTPITFQVTNPTSEGLEIKVYPVPAFTGTPVIRVYPSGTNPMACDPDTETFNPLYKKFLRRSNAYGIRVNGWYENYETAQINTLIDWADRQPLTHRTWVSVNDTDGVGVPPEVPLLLAQEMYEEDGFILIPWLTFAVGTSDDFHTNLATWAAANINAAIPIWLEFGNEIWNTGFTTQRAAVLAQANADGIAGTDTQKIYREQAWRSSEINEIWRTAFGGLTRLKRVLGVQFKDWPSPTDVATYMDYAIPGALTTPDDYHDYVAIAPYLTIGDPSTADPHDSYSTRADNASYDAVTNSQCGTDAAHITSTLHSGTATSGTTTTVVQTGAGWTPSAFSSVSAQVCVTDVSGGSVVSCGIATANTTDTITVSPAFSFDVDASDTFKVRGTVEYSCCATSTCVGYREFTDEQFCASLLASLESRRLQVGAHKPTVESYTNLDGATLRVVLYEGGPNHDNRGGGSDFNITGEHDPLLVRNQNYAHGAACMEGVVNTYLDTIYAAIGNQPMFMLNDVARQTRFQHFGFSNHLINANGDQATCENGTMRGAIYWAAKP